MPLWKKTPAPGKPRPEDGQGGLFIRDDEPEVLDAAKGRGDDSHGVLRRPPRDITPEVVVETVTDINPRFARNRKAASEPLTLVPHEETPAPAAAANDTPLTASAPAKPEGAEPVVAQPRVVDIEELRVEEVAAEKSKVEEVKVEDVEPKTPRASSSDAAPGLRITAKRAAAATVEAAPVATPAPGAVPESSKPGLMGRFGKKAAVSDKPVTAKEASSAFAGLKARYAAAQAAAAAAKTAKAQKSAEAAQAAEAKKATKAVQSAEKPKGAKPLRGAKASKTAAPPRGKVKSLDILVELDADRSVYWRVTADSFVQVEAAEVREAASFSSRDYRYFAEKPLSYGEAYDLALSELGEDCRIVNASKTREAVFAAAANRVQELGVPVGPGLLLVEALLGAEEKTDKEQVVGLLLSDAETTQSLAVLYHVSANGVISTPQITVNPDNLNFTISQFAASKRLDVSSAEVVLFKNAELLSVATHLQLYPNETVWRGVPVRKILWAGVLGVMAVTAGTAAYAGQAYVRMQWLQSEQAEVAAQVKQLDAAMQAEIGGSLSSFARTQSVNVQEVTDRAAQLWVPHAKVTLEATSAQQRYDMLMPLVGGSFSNNRPSVLGQLAARDVQPLIKLDVPEGCSKDIPGISGGVDAIQVTVSCESAASPVDRYRLD